MYMCNKDLTTCAARDDTYNLCDDVAINNNRRATTLTSGFFFSNGYLDADLPTGWGHCFLHIPVTRENTVNHYVWYAYDVGTYIVLL